MPIGALGAANSGVIVTDLRWRLGVASIVIGLVGLSWAGRSAGATSAGPTSAVITTVAGGGAGDGGPATRAMFAGPGTGQITWDSTGNLYVADAEDNRVRKIDRTGEISTVAGTGLTYSTPPFEGVAPSNGDGGPASLAALDSPRGVAVDGAGDVYISDTVGNRVRRVAPSGTITTIAGNGSPCPLGVCPPSVDGERATLVNLNSPTGLALDPAGNLYIADNFSGRVLRVDAAGIATTVAGTETPSPSCALTGAGCANGDGGAATSASLREPTGLAFDAAGNLLIAEEGNYPCPWIELVFPSGGCVTLVGNDIRKVDRAGIISTVAVMPGSPWSVATDAVGNLVVSSAWAGVVWKVDPSGRVSQLTKFPLATGAAVGIDPTGAVTVATTEDVSRMYRLDAVGAATVIAGGGSGDGMQATNALLVTDGSAAVDPAGGLYFVGGNELRKVGKTGVLTTIAGTRAPGFSGDGGPAAGATLAYPHGVAVDAAENVYVADSANNRVRKIDSSGTITTIAGTGSAGFSGDGGPATAAELNDPYGLTVDSSGAVLVADARNNRVRRIDPSGIITTIAGSGQPGFSGDGGPATAATLAQPLGLSTDKVGDLYIADWGNSRIREVTPAGVITTVAGGGTTVLTTTDAVPVPATLASIQPADVTVDSSGNLYIPDPPEGDVRRVDSHGLMTAVAGATGAGGASGDGGPPSLAGLEVPHSVAVDSTGALYIVTSDSWDAPDGSYGGLAPGLDRIRKITGL